LETGPIRRLGASSYSLYLTHGPIVVIVYERLVAGHVRQGVPLFLVSLAVVVPLTIAFARVFAAVFETPRPLARAVTIVAEIPRQRRGSGERDDVHLPRRVATASGPVRHAPLG
jgi:peptidoglycan/LPS O-acetylase OafA/YrhL